MKKLEDLASHLGVRIIETNQLNKQFNAKYLHPQRVIIMQLGLDPFTYRSCLAHELGHAFYRDEAMNDPKLERRADIFAANLLITEEAFKEAEALWPGELGAIAYELGVTPHLVEVWVSCREVANHGAA